MLRLYVMRHAKSSWAVPGARDFDRELNDRGLSDLGKLASAMKEKSYTPDLVLCSAAIRTRQTVDGISAALSPDAEIVYTEKLYSSGVDDYLNIIRDLQDAGSAMIVGHNPMCGVLASSLSGSGTPALLESIAYKYPTGTISVIDFDVTSWKEVANQAGKLSDVLIPSNL